MKKQNAADLQQDYLDAMELSVAHVVPGTPKRALELFSKFADDLSREPGVEFAELRVIALLNLCRVHERLREADESERARQEAIAMLDQLGAPGSKLNIQDRLADVLVDFGEYRRAIGPCEQAIQLSRGASVKLANRLWRAGRNYLRAGFKQHAEEPLRKAVEFFRAQKADPRTPVILIDLGNALRTSNPAEAERTYLEAAAIWESRGALGQATTAWVNLGITCGEQGRLDESLQWYEKVRRVREADAGTPRNRLGSLANNIANVHRRLKNFELATQEAEKAVGLLEGDPVLAEAYGTHGLILRDQGLDERALPWFQRARLEHLRQPSPNVSQLDEALGNEAAALARLGRVQEADALEQERAKLRGDVPPVQKHEVTPVVTPAKKTDGEAGAVLVELDGVHLPESVYRECDMATLENRIEEVLEGGEYGELDGHETGPENTTMFLYGGDAEALFRAVEPVLRDYPLCQGAWVTIRQDGKERRVVLG